MIFQKMTICNFRQFYNTQSIEFSTNKKKNITVIHGFNGSGKTALLNAFIWCLYGETTPDLEFPEKLESERALAEAKIGDKVLLSVKVKFNDKDNDYIVERKRTTVVEKRNEYKHSSTELNMWKIAGNGELLDAERHPQELIHRILPIKLYPFFFFNGERLGDLAKPEAFEHVEEGIKTLLDVEIYERAVNHLRGAVTLELSKELKQFGGVELNEIIEKEAETKDKIDKNREKKETLKKNMAGIQTEIQRYEGEQKKLEQIKEFTQKRDNLRDHKKSCDKQISELTSDIAKAVSEDGFLSFTKSVFDTSIKLVTDARERGELPAKIKPQFVEDLINNKKCICGRALAIGSQEMETLEIWKSKTGLAALEEGISQTYNSIIHLNGRAEKFYVEIDKLQARKAELITKRREIKEDLSVLEEKIKDPIHGETAEDLANKIQQFQDQLINTQVDIKTLEKDYDLLNDYFGKIKKELAEAKSFNDKAIIIQKQKASVDNVANALDKIYIILKEDVRCELSEIINTVWRDAAVKDYQASVNDSYQLVLTKDVAGNKQFVHGTSTGEKIVLAQSFVGSLVKKAGKNLEKAKETGDTGIIVGGEYPLIMDSPFGYLEDDYRTAVAEWVPKLAHQVIVLVSKTQWRDEVENAMKSKIGKEFILELHTQKQNADKSITIFDKEYPYVVSTNDPCEQTIIKEVKL